MGRIGRRATRPVLVVILAASLAASLVAGCSGATPTPIIVYVTPAPTASPTPEPTPSPTPQPSPTATPVPWTSYFRDALCRGLVEAPKIYARYTDEISGPVGRRQWSRVASIVAATQSDIAALKADLPRSDEWPESFKLLLGLNSALTGWSLTLGYYDLMAQFAYYDRDTVLEALSSGALTRKDYSTDVLGEYKRLNTQYGFACEGVPSK